MQLHRSEVYQHTSGRRCQKAFLFSCAAFMQTRHNYTKQMVCCILNSSDVHSTLEYKLGPMRLAMKSCNIHVAYLCPGALIMPTLASLRQSDSTLSLVSLCYVEIIEALETICLKLCDRMLNFIYCYCHSMEELKPLLQSVVCRSVLLSL